LHEAHYILAAILLQQSKLEEAAASLRKAIEIRPDYPEAHYALGSVLQQQGNFAGAVTALRQALVYAPNAAEIRNALGTALRQTGDIESARVEFQEAARLNKIKSNQQAAIFATNTGLAKLKEGNLDAAIERFQSAVKLDPTNAQAYYSLAKAFEQKGQVEAARAAEQKAKQLDPKIKSVP
jgi:Flp pilus assembly protein TadD